MTRERRRRLDRAALPLVAGIMAVGAWALLVTPDVLADDTGWLSPSANAADSGGDGNGFEVNPQNAYANGGGAAASVNNGAPGGWLSPDDPTDLHRYYNYGFSVPAGATIEGIEVRLDWRLDGSGGTNEIRVDLSWDGGTSWTSYQSDASEPTSWTTVVLGGTADLWGRSWTYDEFNNANFRVRVHCYSDPVDQRAFYLDWVPVRVTYSAGVPGQVAVEKGVTPQLSESPGQVVTYTYVITISNAGPSNVSVQQIVDTLPAGFTYVTTTATSGIRFPDSIVSAGSSVTWSYNTPYPRISAGAFATLTFVATSSNSVGSYCNTVAVTCGGSIGTVTQSNLACVTIRWPTFDIEAEVLGLRIIVRVRIENGQPVILSWEIIP